MSKLTKDRKRMVPTILLLAILALATFFIFQYINRAPIPPTNQAQSIREEVLKEDPGATFIENGENYLKFRLSDGQYRLVSSMGGLYTKDGLEIDTALSKTSGEWFVQTGPSLDYILQFKKDSTRRYIPRKDYPDEYIETGAPQYLNRDEWRVLSLGSVDIEGNRIAWNQFNHTLEYLVGPDGVKMNLILKRPSAEHQFRWPVVYNGLTLQTDNSVVSNTDSQVVTNILSPVWYDAQGQSDSIDWGIQGGYINLDPQIPDDAVYPVTVDPSLSKTVGAVADNGLANQQTMGFATPSSLGTSFGGLSDTCPWRNTNNLWLRFANITIPQGVYVAEANVIITAQNGSANPGSSVTVYGVDEDNHSAPTNYSTWLVDHGMHTTASVAWGIPTHDQCWFSYGEYPTPDIRTIIQEIIDRSGWASNNAIGIHVDDTASSFGASRTIYMYTTTWSGYNIYAPRLVVTYAGPSVVVAQSNGSTSVTEGGVKDTYTVVLGYPPTATVTINVSDDAEVNANTTPLVFTTTDWNVPQTVAVLAEDDAKVEASPHTGTITHAASSSDSNYNGISISSVTVNVIDNGDAAGISIKETP